MCMVNDVSRFMAASGQIVASEKLQQLYRDLVLEEFGELADSETREEELDAICDLIWVLIGYGLSRGYNVDCAWKEVARSNLDKIDTLSGTVLKREDGKVLKPADWQGPNLATCV